MEIKKLMKVYAILAAAALMAVSCNKVENKFPEENLVGEWEIPAIDSTRPDYEGKILTIHEDHTAEMYKLSFNYWKLEGDEVTFTRYQDEGDPGNAIGQMKMTVVNITDTNMRVKGRYIHTNGDTIDNTFNVGGLYKKILPPQPEENENK